MPPLTLYIVELWSDDFQNLSRTPFQAPDARTAIAQGLAFAEGVESGLGDAGRVKILAASIGSFDPESRLIDSYGQVCLFDSAELDGPSDYHEDARPCVPFAVP